MASLVVFGGGGDGENAEGGESVSDDQDLEEKDKPYVPHRKRKKSVRDGDGSYLPPYKKNRFRRQMSVLPSKFLLGGNIRDPLNLASLADAKVNAEVNKITPPPTSSPLNVPSSTNINHNQHQGQIPVFIPKNPVDPLGLSLPTDNPEDIIAGVRTNKHKKRHRKRHGRKRTDSECSVGTDNTVDEDEENVEVRQETQKKETTGSKLAKKDSEKEVKQEKNEGKKDWEEQRKSGEPSNPVSTAPIERRSKEDIASGDSIKTIVEVAKKLEDLSSRKEEKFLPKPEMSVGTVPAKDPTKEEHEKTTDKDKDKPISGSGSGPSDSKITPKGNEDQSGGRSGAYPCKSSEYVPLSSSYAPSPYIFDTMNPEDGFEIKPFESPSLTNYYCNAVTPSHLMEPFSPPPPREIPHFQKRMQLMSAGPPRPHELSLQRAVFQKPFYRRRFRHRSDPIVSPVIPQPGCGKKRGHHHHHNHRHGKKNNDKQGNSLNTSSTSTNSSHSSSSRKGGNKTNKQTNNEIKSFRSKDEIYQFGNYKQYYGYRTLDGDDNRLWVLKKDWFRGKDVLDIGCNIGHVTLSIARDFEARRVHGIDIDNNLITTARKNIKHYMIHDPSDKNVVFPNSLPMIYGAMQPPTGGGVTPQQFPFNVIFSQVSLVFICCNGLGVRFI